MSVNSLLEASYSKQRHHKSVYHWKQIWKRRVRSASTQACYKARVDNEHEFPDVCIRGRQMGNSKARRVYRQALVEKFFLSRVGKHVDDVMQELHAKLGYSDTAHEFWREMQSRFNDEECKLFYKGHVDYYNVRIELDEDGILTRVDLGKETKNVSYEGPSRGEVERWTNYRSIEKDGETLFWVKPRCVFVRGEFVLKDPAKVPFSREDHVFLNRLDEARKRDLLEFGHIYDDYAYL